jgi:hypothetical protein
MDDSSAPVKLPAIWANGATSPYVRSIPVASQVGIQNGAASLFDGFPPNCFIPLAAGGAGPFGSDHNGILQQVTAGLQWVQAGGPWVYDAAFQTAIGGYPKSSIVASATTAGRYWWSSVDNNLTDPDTGGAGWLSFQLPPVNIAGPTLRLTANLSAAGTTVAFTADYISVATSLGGGSATLAAFSKSLNVSGTSAGGMDTGSAPTSGFVSIYAIYNPATGSSALLGTTASQTTIYGGSHMPSGYTMSALVAVWPTNSSADLVVGFQQDRMFYWGAAQTVLTGGNSYPSHSSISLSSFVPVVARSAYMELEASSSPAGGVGYLASTSTSYSLAVVCAVADIGVAAFGWIPLPVSQTCYYYDNNNTTSTTVYVLGYGI